MYKFFFQAENSMKKQQRFQDKENKMLHWFCVSGGGWYHLLQREKKLSNAAFQCLEVKNEKY